MLPPCPPLYLHLLLPNSSPPPRSSTPHISLLLPSPPVTLLLFPYASSPTSLFPLPSPTPLAPTAQFTYNQYLSQKFSGGKEEWFEIHFFHSSHDGKRVVVWG